ncbi:MAG: hypothetical protein JXR96_29515 [Deltaproteobacteria bacterium]|nr:hypothetical protein [Deltaproteobacteria bacterium]
MVICRERIADQELRRLVERFFGDMVKIVIDVRRRVLAAGGELHADAEQVLLADGSLQADLWGANYYPATDPERCIEYTALINIRPSQDNPSMEVTDEATRRVIREIVYTLLGRGEAL